MLVTKEQIKEIDNFLMFYKPKHKKLSIRILEEVANEIDFKLKIQKASIQLVTSQAFAVIGLRRSQESIFIEFYSKSKIDNDRIVKTIKGKNRLEINRINIFNENEINKELIKFILHSNELIA